MIMAEFHYTARPLSGVDVQGTITAASRQDVIQTLAGQALFPLRVDEVAPRAVVARKVAARLLAPVYSQLADLLHAGVSLLKALEIIAEQNSQPAVAQVLDEVRDRVANGMSLAQAMLAHPQVFPELVASIVRAGEEAGFLEDALKRIALFTERQEELKSRVLGAVAYPAFLLVAGTLIVIGMLVFFVPNFTPIFERLAEAGELPLPTRILMFVSDLTRRHGIVLALLFLGVAWLLWRLATGESGRRFLARWQLELRIVGPIVQGIAIARFCRVLGTLLHNGVPILQSLRVAKDATGNQILRDAIAQAADNLSSGKTLAQPLAACGRFPREVIEMIAIGEKANRLDQVLIDVADTLERRTGRQLDLFVRLLEPAMLLVMAGVILFLVIALLLPVFQASTSVG